MPKLKRERIIKKNLVGKTIRATDDSYPGVVRLSFTDGSSAVFHLYPPPNPPPTINMNYYPSAMEVPVRKKKR